MKPLRFTDYIWRNVRSSIVLSWVLIVAASLTIYTGLLIRLKGNQLRGSLKIAADTVNRALQAGDWPLALGHLQTFERVGHAFEIRLDGSAKGTDLAGPFGERPFGIGTVCASEKVGASADVSACMRVLGSAEVYTLGYFLLFSLLLFLVALKFVQRKMLLFVRHVSDELKSIPAADPRATDRAGVAIEEVDAIRTHMVGLLDQIEKASASQALARLSLQVAHDIRSPLAALDSVIRDVAQLPEEKRVVIRSAVGRIHDIANDLIGKNRELAGPPGEAAAAPLDETSRELLSSHIGPIVTEKRMRFRSSIGVAIESRLDPGSYGLFADIQPVEFKRVLSNLIDNAVQALDGKGSVTVVLSRDGDRALLRVEDTGKGIPPELLGKLGQHGMTFGKPTGSGVGLYHAKSRVEAWGGSLDISSAVGCGTAVAAALPAAPPPAWFVSQLELAPDSPVVILDDDTTIHRIWQGRFDSLALVNAGIEAIHISSAEGLRQWAAANAEKASRALYLLDYELRESNETGLTLAAEMNLGARAILVTSRFEEKVILDECLRLGIRMIPKGLAGFVPIACPIFSQPDVVLIDDDDLVHAVWNVAAKENGKTLGAFSTAREFLAVVNRLSKETPIYMDSKLRGGIRGEEVAKKLYAMGFRNLYLSTGGRPETFPPMPWIKQVVGKEAPWTEIS